MNAPLFNAANLKAPYGSAKWCQEFSAESARCCDAIDARIGKVQSESIELSRQLDDAEKTLETTKGILARWSIRLKIKGILHQQEYRRKMLLELWEARMRRTISW